MIVRNGKKEKKKKHSTSDQWPQSTSITRVIRVDMLLVL